MLLESVIFSVTLGLLLPVFFFYSILFSLSDSSGYLVICLNNYFSVTPSLVSKNCLDRNSHVVK